MKPKLTKSQRARAKRALLDTLAPKRWAVVGVCGAIVRDCECCPEWPEVERLLRVALRAVRGA